MHSITDFSFVDGRQLLSDTKFYEGYSRFLPEKNRHETWEEAVSRVMDMHREFFKSKNKYSDELESLISEAQDAYNKKIFLGSQRALQFGGKQLLSHHAKLFNCIGTCIDRPEAFGEGFYWLLAGCGLGGSVQLQHVNKLPMVVPRTKQPKLHVIEDSIEGWAKSLDVLMSSFFKDGGKHTEFMSRKVYFDWNKIRPKGALISGGFLAPGPEPLVLALNKIENILIHASEQKRQLKSIEIYDIMMHVADAVISGGVRRSATIFFFSKEDSDMMNAKTGNWFAENPQRGRSNNTVVLKRDETTYEEFKQIINSVKEFGEPGFFFTDDYDYISNPCVEIGFWPFLDNGDGTVSSGSEGCNLAEINGSLTKTKEDLYYASRCAAIVSTLQAAYTDFKFVSETTKKIFDKEALLGISITGWMENPDVLFDKETLNNAVDIIREVNKKVAKMIGINQAARLTCTKPSGNSSVLLKTASGIHGQHNKPYYIRHAQFNKKSKTAEALYKEIPVLFEESAWSQNKTDWAVAFPVIVDDNALTKNDLLGTKLLEKVKFAQEHWVIYGTNEELCARPGLKHNISNTITVDDWDKVADYIFENRNYLTGVSLLGMTGDKDYVQAPNTAVYMPKELIDMYGIGVILASGLVVDAIHAFGSLWTATDYVKYDSEISEETHNKAIMIDWIRRFKKFSSNYFESDMTMAEYCLKDVHNLHRWLKIQAAIQKRGDIDWNELLSEETLIDIDTMGAIACSGGACEI
jgi:ribonucleoside-triphosphate reductase (thioredoxin)